MLDASNPDFKSTPTSLQRPNYNYYPAAFLCKPMASIVTPFYNTGSVFEETAQSVLQQSFQQWEWIIVNDGSDDKQALEILEPYRMKEPRVRVLDHTSNRGLSATRNTGARNASSAYIVFLDSDDLLEPTAIEKWFWLLETHPGYAFVKGYSVGFGDQEYLWQQGFHCGNAFLRKNLVDVTSMVRKAVFDAAGGFDESNRGGLEDWDFWLRCASLGHWGGTVPEYLDWYRRRNTHSDRWENLDDGARQSSFRKHLKTKYPHLNKETFPRIQDTSPLQPLGITHAIPCRNELKKTKPRILMLLPWMTLGGADKFNLDVLRQLTQRGWEVSIATTLNGDHSWLPEFSKHTPDIFILSHFLRIGDYPRFLRYLINSRQIDVVFLSHSELGYHLLPYLRAYLPDVTFVDYCHIEEEWQDGGFPRLSVDLSQHLDLSLVASQYLKNWMVRRGRDPKLVEPCYINVDPQEWAPDSAARARIRNELQVHDKTPVIIYPCRLCPQKQPFVFLQVMERLRRERRLFVCLVVGEGEDRLKLEALAQSHQLDSRIRFLGMARPQRMRELMAASDILFLPSKHEGIALCIYEAMSTGLAVVGADVGGQMELVTEGCGLLFPTGNEAAEVEAYSQALSELLKDPEKRRGLGTAARERVLRSFRLEQMGHRLTELIANAQHVHHVNQLLAKMPPTEDMELSSSAIAYMRKTLQRGTLRQHNCGARMYQLGERILGPVYQYALDHHCAWVTPLKECIKDGIHRIIG